MQKLAGQKLSTLDQRKPFNVIAVSDQHVMIKVLSTGNDRVIAREEIEQALIELNSRGQITRAEIQEKHSPRNPAYVAAMLAALPGVKYSLQPIVLRLA